ncbi:MAG: DUF2470 domain-containing protein [Pseudomonadota bacterium]
MTDRATSDAIPPEKGARDVLQPVDGEARALGLRLIRSARFAALGTLDPADGAPHVSRTNCACDISGAPVFLISRLSTHFGALEADARASLLFGEPGKGDPLAHPRITVIGKAKRVADGPDRDSVRARFLRRHPKSALYVDFADFAFWRLEPERASMAASFGAAYQLEGSTLLSPLPDLDVLAASETGAVEHMNDDHADAVDRYAAQLGASSTGWRLANLDAEGVDLVRGDAVLRRDYLAPMTKADDLRATLIRLAKA